MKKHDDERSGLFLRSEPLDDIRRRSAQKKDGDKTDGILGDKGDDDSTDSDTDSDGTDEGDGADDSRDSDGKD